jgi:hypothetical protein
MHNSIEVISFFIFAFYFYKAWKNRDLSLLFVSALFAFIFENLGVILSAGMSGGYYYSESFRFFLLQTPLFVILLWSVIIYSSYRIIKALVSGPSLFFLASLYVLMLDIVLDQMATKLGFWTWIGFERYQGLYSVPAPNYIGWLILPLIFLAIWDYWRGRRWRYLTPFLASIVYMIVVLPFYLIKVRFFDHDPRLQYGILFFFLATVSALGVYFFEKGDRFYPRDWTLFLVRFLLHLFSLIFLIINFNSGLIWLAIVFAFIIALEALVFWEYKKTDP